VIVEGVDILEKIRKSKAKDDKVIKAVEEMKKAGVKMLRDNERGKRGFSCDKQKINGSGSSPQLHAKGSEGRMVERGDKKD